ncbi:cytochrome c oxidase subunit I, partial [Candidatus Poribacteria bacterium]|nr:cytochrome c oxidase subunit I [Candidatus Poribacteria bacterium]
MHESHEHHSESFITHYIFSKDHKMIARQFLIYGLLMLILGGLLALFVRWELAFPKKPLPFIGVSKTYQETGEAVTGMDKMWDRLLNSGTENWLTKNLPGGV